MNKKKRKKYFKQYTIEEILTSKNTLVVPRYQRRYSWKKNNIKVFVDDIISSVKISKEKIQFDDYFIGIMIFNGTLKDKTCNEIDIIDGQQRISTIIMILAYICKKLEKINPSEQRKIFKHIVFSKAKTENYSFINKSCELFFCDCLNDPININEKSIDSEEAKSIYNAYSIINNLLDENSLTSKFNNQLSYENSLITIYKQLMKCYVFAIETNNSKEANIYFETINGKGLNLLPVDLIKNKIFESLSDKPADIPKEKWNKIINRLYQDKNHSADLQTFVRHYWNSIYEHSTDKTLFSNFKKKYNNTIMYKRFIEELLDNSLYYMQIVYPKLADFDNNRAYTPLINSLTALDDFNVVLHRVPLMSLLYAKERKIVKASTLIKIAEFIEAFHFEYNVISHKSNNSVEKIYSKYAGEIRKCNSKKEVIDITNTELFDVLRPLLPDKNTVIQEIRKFKYTKKKKINANIKTRYVIKTINCIYEKDFGLINDGSIEHIINEEEGEFTLNIGNLICIEEKYNKMMNDDGIKLYRDKIKYYKRSDYKWIKGFPNKHKSFSKNDFKSRSLDIANKIYKELDKKINVKLK